LRSGLELLAPELICAEFANAIWAKFHRHGLPAAEASAVVREFLIDTPLKLHPLAPLTNRATEIALQLDHPVYDCFYLALAERERCPLVTADERLPGAVKGTDLEPLVVAL
jgi:predicted nucleic acid-binding protein